MPAQGPGQILNLIATVQLKLAADSIQVATQSQNVLAAHLVIWCRWRSIPATVLIFFSLKKLGQKFRPMTPPLSATARIILSVRFLDGRSLPWHWSGRR